MKNLKKISILMILTMVLFAMTACGGSDSESNPSGEDLDASANQELEVEDTQEDRAETDISEEFKATMDSYEEFFDDYVDFMKKYQENPTDASLLTESAEMLTKEAEMMKELEAMDESEMTTAEAAYYLEVMARINEKLASVL